MTRKLPFLLVVVTAISTVSLLQAQDCQCPGLKSKSCATCQSGVATATKTPQKESEVVKCSLDCEREECTACRACSLVAEVKKAAAEATATMNPETAAMQLPGFTSFIQEQSPETANQREQLAVELTSYLTSNQHDPRHIQRVLHMALNSAADAAHRHAMMGATPNTQPDPPETTYYHGDDVQYFPRGPEFVLEKPSQPPQPVIKESARTAMDLRHLQREQEVMQNSITLIQQDLQKIAQHLSQLHVESRMNHSTQANNPRPFARARNVNQYAPQGTPQTNGSIPWQSVQNPYASQPLTAAGMAHHQIVQQRASQYQPTTHHQGETVESLKREVHRLQAQLQQMRVQGNQVRQADFQESIRLEPRKSSNMMLTPAASPQITTVYYVGDLMEPPFAGATLKLMQFIKSNVAPDSWTDSHMMQIAEPSISLVITQTPENHEQVARLIRQIRTGARSYMAGGNGQRR